MVSLVNADIIGIHHVSACAGACLYHHGWSFVFTCLLCAQYSIYPSALTRCMRVTGEQEHCHRGGEAGAVRGPVASAHAARRRRPVHQQESIRPQLRPVDCAPQVRSRNRKEITVAFYHGEKTNKQKVNSRGGCKKKIKCI